MDSAPSPDVCDAKPSFRKPANVAANKKYRRHSSAEIPDSSSSDGTPKVERNHSPTYCKDQMKMDVNRRKNEDKGSDKQAPVNYRDYHKHDDQGRHQRDAFEEESHLRNSSQSAQDSRSGNRFEHGKHESYQNRAREGNHNVDKSSRDKVDIDRPLRDKSDDGRYSRDKPDNHTHRSKETIEYHRHNDRRLSNRAVSGGRYDVSYKDEFRSRERYWHRDRGDRDEKRERPRNLGDYKNDPKMFHEGDGAKGRERDSRVVRDESAVSRREAYLSNTKERDENLEHKKKTDDRGNDKRKDRHAGVQDEEIQNQAKDKDGNSERNKYKFTYEVDPPSTKRRKSGDLEKLVDEGVKMPEKDTAACVNSETVGSSSSQAEANQDFNAAKVAAMKAAELVNRNLIGGAATGLLSTDQKKKLLWGNKKSNTVEESGNRWDLPLFTDRERQEKFNKLMSLRLPWCLWPTVGCEGGPEGGEQTRRQGWDTLGRETGAASDGLGEAIHCWASETGWQNSRSWPVTGISAVSPGTPGEHTLNSFCVLLFWFWLNMPMPGCQQVELPALPPESASHPPRKGSVELGLCSPPCCGR